MLETEHHSHKHNHAHHHLISKENERKTLTVIIITLITMFAEIIFGYLSNSMALLADGWHMGTHALALGMAFVAYIFIRKIHDRQNGHVVSEKISALSGFVSAMFLFVMAIFVMVEAIGRFINPLNISFNEAILIAVIGLVVNLICICIMENKHTSDNDYNYKAAYIHIVTDAMTSVFAIIALIMGKYFGLTILDPVMGIVASILILRWSISLIKNTSKIILDINLLK